MISPTLREDIIAPSARLISGNATRGRVKRYMQSSLSKHVILLLFTGLLLCSSYTISNNQPAVHAANPGTGNACSWYKVRWGDTLSSIARGHGSTVGLLAQVNSIRTINLIFVGQEICLPYRAGASTWRTGSSSAGLLANGVVVWYDHNALQWSTRPQVAALLRQAAAHFGLPANLLLAIAWQESGWYQHVIAWDGGIGVMQLMPYTAMGINAGTGMRRDPYRLWDNISLGATYLSWLWRDFHGYLVKVISAYNEGGWAVIHRGIFNWRYVYSVLALMKRF